MDCSEYRNEWIAADVDGRLGRREAEVREHLSGCPGCRALRDQHAALQETLRSRGLLETAPAWLRSRIVATIEEEAAEEDRGAWLRPAAWGALFASAVAVAVLAVLLVRPGPVSDPVGPMLAVYDAAAKGDLAVTLETNAPERLEAYFRGRGNFAFPPTVLDLGPAGFRLVGGTLRKQENTVSRVSLYRDDGRLLVCDRRSAANFPGPVPAEGKPQFFSRDGVSFCVSRHGPEVCCLMARMPLDEFRSRLAKVDSSLVDF